MKEHEEEELKGRSGIFKKKITSLELKDVHYIDGRHGGNACEDEQYPLEKASGVGALFSSVE